MKIESNACSIGPDYKQIPPDKLIFTPLLVVLILSACSPHPAAHTWVSNDENILGLNKISVVFEGTADFYSLAANKSIRRCFWGAKTRNTIELNCVHSDNTAIEETYELEVTGRNKARLRHNNTFITELSRQSIRDEELKKIEADKKQKQH